MCMKPNASLNLEQLTQRLVPSTATFSNGLLFVQGDNLGNNINVIADADGTLRVTERGENVPIAGAVATTANVKTVVQQAGTGNNNRLATDASLGAIPNTLLGNGTGTVTYAPGNNAPSQAFGSPNPLATNHFISNPGGKDTFVGGAGRNLFDWEPGTGTDVYVGKGRLNAVLVVGNSNGLAEEDTLQPDGQGGVIYSRLNLVPFKLFTSGIQEWYLQPSTGAGNNVVIGDLTGTPTKRVRVDVNNSKVDAGAQENADVRLVVNGRRNTVIEGAGPTRISRDPVLSPADILRLLRERR